MPHKQPNSSETSALEKIRRHTRIIIDLARLAAEDIDLERFLHLAVLQVARAVDIDHVKIMTYRRDKADLILAAGVGWKQGVVGSATFPSDLRSPPGRSYQTAEPVVISDTGKAVGFAISPVLREHGIVSLANVPILISSAAWGVLEVDSSSKRDFSDDTVEFLTAAAALIAGAVQRHSAGRDRAAALAELAAQAQAREMLLREMQHRVKNNFQLILSSISIQKRRFTDEEVHRALNHVASRINAISIAHDQLSVRQNVRMVDLASYFRALCTSIEQQAENIAIDLEADEVEVAIERAVPLGLILNEAVTNSVKHAFGGEGGRISVTLTSGVGRGEGRLIMSDNGRGFEKSPSGGSGLKLMSSLARQIGGSLEVASTRGTTTTVTFPILV